MNKKPRIIITMHYLELGGAEMALIGLLHALDPDKVDVDLFIYSHQGPLMKFIPDWINLLPEIKSYSMIERPMTEALRNGQFSIVVARILAKWRHNQYIKHTTYSGDDASALQYIGNAVTPLLTNINPEVEYDLCISFHIPHNIGIDKIRAKRRLAWIHTDYSAVHFNAELELPVWNAYDHIAAISPAVRKSFEKTFPTLTDKIIDIENIISSEFIKRRAEELDSSSEMSGIPSLLSIGRFCFQKNFDNVPDIAARMVNNGLKDLKWYLIGYGGDEVLIRKKIAESNMENHVIILGKKENPYPYIKACDIYIQPSRYEGKSVTVREAQILGKPVVITNYPTAKSQLRDGIDGIIVPLNNKWCADGIIKFIENKLQQRKISLYCTTHDFANTSEIDKIYKILNEENFND